MNESILPEADMEGFIDHIKQSYLDNRWSDVYQTDKAVTIWSGKHPAFSRFQADIRPKLHEHGLVISETRTNVPKTIDGESEKVHWISAIPMAKAVAESHNLLCNRGACTNLVADAQSDYCDQCGPIIKKVEA